MTGTFPPEGIESAILTVVDTGDLPEVPVAMWSRSFRSCSSALFFLAVVGLSASAGESADASAILAKYQEERAETAKYFRAEELTAADKLAERARQAISEQNPAAVRLAREARWALPYRPTGLPDHILRVIGAVRLRHADRINGLAFSPDGQRLASASRDGSVRLWDLGNGRELLNYRDHTADLKSQTEDTNVFRVPAVAFSPDGQTVASSGGATIHVWDSRTGKRLQTLTGHKGVAKAIVFSRDGTTLVSGSDDKQIIVWDLKTGRPKFTISDQVQRVEAVSISTDGRLIAAVNAAGELSVYNGHTAKRLLQLPVTESGQASYGVAFVLGRTCLATAGGDNRPKLIGSPDPDGGGPGAGQTVRTFTGHSDKVNTLCSSEDGKWLATGSKDKSVRIWDAASGKQLWSFQGHLGQVTAVAFSPDGKQVASGGEDGIIRVWPLSTTDEHRAMNDARGPLWTTAFSPDGSRFATAGADQIIRMYDAFTGKLLKSFTGHKGAITAIVFLDNRRLASASGDKLVKIWNLETGTAVDLPGHDTAVLAISADAAGKLLLSGSVDKSVKAWDPASGQRRWEVVTKSAVCAVAVRNDGQQAAIGMADGTLQLLAVSADAAKAGATVTGHLAGVAAVVYSPDGSRLASCGGDGVVRLWNLSDSAPPSPARKFEPLARSGSTANPMSTVAFSSDGRYLLAGGADGLVHVWDIQAGAEILSLRGHTDWITSVSFRPDGQAIVSVAVDQTARLFDLNRPDTEATASHSLPIRSLAIHPDGKRLATASEDRTVKVWDLDTGRELATLTGAADAVNAVGFAGPNRIVAAGEDQRVRWWQLDPVKELRSVPSGRVFNLATTPDGSRTAVVWARITDNVAEASFELLADDGSPPVQILEKNRPLSCAVIAADASLGITGGTDGVVRIWNLASKERVGADWPLFSTALADVGITADKATLAAIDAEGTIKVADISRREVRSSFAAVSDGVNALVVSRSGNRIATLSAEGQVVVWSPTGKELRRWKLPTIASAGVFTPKEDRLVTANKDGTIYILEVPDAQ